MDFAALLAYFAALTALTAAPGPVMAVVVARSLGHDARGAAAFAAGLVLGDVLAVCAVAIGVGVWAESMPGWFAIAKYAGVAYLLWLSVGLWNNKAGTADTTKSGWLASTGAGVALCLGNPSTILIYMLLLPTVAPTGFSGLDHFALVALVTFVAVAAVFFGTILLARQVNRIISSPTSASIFSRATAVVIALTSIWILAV
jgi:threonine/homoserine/homoserine lactone efflux protein